LVFVYVLLCDIQRINCLYSTKTAYHDSFNKAQLDFINNKNNYLIENCKPEQIYLIVRHGARYPSQKQAIKAAKCLERLKTQTDNIESIVFNIENTFIDKPDYGLTDLGAIETRQISQRFKHRYPDIFADLTVDQVNLKSSTKARSYESGTNFTKVLFEQNNINASLDDDMLRGFDNCKKYANQMNIHGPTLKKKMNLFKESKHVKQIIANFKSRHSIAADHDVRIGKKKDPDFR
jgi:hypothetical protein